MKLNTIYSATLCGLLMPAAFVFAERPLEELLHEDTIFYAKVGNLEQLQENYAEHPIVQIFEEDDVQAFFAPLLQGNEEKNRWERIKEHLEIDNEVLKEHFSGQALFAITRFNFDRGKGDFLLLLEHGGDFDETREIMMKALEGELVEEEFMGHTLYVDEIAGTEDTPPRREAWTVVDDVYVLGTSVPDVEDVVARLEGESASETITGNESYRKMMDYSPDADMQAFFNAEPFIELFEARVLEESADSPPNMLGITAGGVLNALALDSLESVFVSVDISGEVTDLSFGVLYKEKRGIFSLFAYEDREPFMPGFVPHDALSATSIAFSIPAMWSSLENMLSVLSPSLMGMYQMNLTNFSNSMQVDIRSSLIDSLGSDIAAYAAFPPGQSGRRSLEDAGQIITISLLDRQGFELALNTIFSLITGGAPVFEAREYQGTTLYFMVPEIEQRWTATGNQPIAYALMQDQLVLAIGPYETLETAVANINDPGETLWDTPNFRDAVDRLPDGGSEVRYNDMEALLDSLFVMLAELQVKLRSLPNTDASYEICDPEALPEEKDFPYVMVGRAYDKPDGFYGKTLLIEKSE